MFEMVTCGVVPVLSFRFPIVTGLFPIELFRSPISRNIGFVFPSGVPVPDKKMWLQECFKSFPDRFHPYSHQLNTNSNIFHIPAAMAWESNLFAKQRLIVFTGHVLNQTWSVDKSYCVKKKTSEFPQFWCKEWENIPDTPDTTSGAEIL